mmetsp:Transcript_22386/g.35906  ORF Transcript_22386/g.35906 Transcript_22386/m.35906 type:complete len:205 (+) Transcript_22386:830-1444(+)
MFGGQAENGCAKRSGNAVQCASDIGQHAEEQHYKNETIDRRTHQPPQHDVAMGRVGLDQSGQARERPANGEVQDHDAEHDVEQAEPVASRPRGGAGDHVPCAGRKGVAGGFHAHHRDPEDREGGDQAPKGEEGARRDFQRQRLCSGFAGHLVRAPFVVIPCAAQWQDQQDHDAHHGQHGRCRRPADRPVARVIRCEKVEGQPLQ